MGLMCVVAGIGAMLSEKGRGRHSGFGTTYYWFLFGVFVSATALAISRWDEDYHLFVLGVLSFAAAFVARQMVRRGPRTRSRLRIHVGGMATSYVLLLTAFYVDNGKNLPLWRELPPIFYWLGRAMIGLPLLVYVLLRHPLVRRAEGGR
jgi:hypothetical protein